MYTRPKHHVLSVLACALMTSGRPVAGSPIGMTSVIAWEVLAQPRLCRLCPAHLWPDCMMLLTASRYWGCSKPHLGRLTCVVVLQPLAWCLNMQLPSGADEPKVCMKCTARAYGSMPQAMLAISCVRQNWGARTVSSCTFFCSLQLQSTSVCQECVM